MDVRTSWMCHLSSDVGSVAHRSVASTQLCGLFEGQTLLSYPSSAERECLGGGAENLQAILRGPAFSSATWR